MTAANHSLGVSGGAIYHTGALRIFNGTFLANKAGVEGAAIISIGVLETLSNVSFSENSYYCRAGEYGHVIENEVSHLHQTSLTVRRTNS